MKKRVDRLGRDLRVPISVPQFGRPAWAKECYRCHLWFPWWSYGKRGRVCLVCRETSVARRREAKKAAA